MIHTQSPGKLIISGEHAAVYNRPALAMAVNCHAETYLEAGTEPGVSFDVPGLDYHLNYDRDALCKLHDQSIEAYDRFLQDELKIQQVLPQAVELIPFAFSLVWYKAGRPQVDDLQVRIDIEIPIGCGMGSSAAVGLGVIMATATHFDVSFSNREMFELSMICERLMHGHPSGVDSHVSLHGGVIRFQAGAVEDRHVPCWSFALLNTGQPESSTGECVETVRSNFADDPIWQDFEATTNAIDEHLKRPMDDELLSLIRRNHRLLCRIGVVPERVQRMVEDIETAGGAAKICGAGAVHGENGGIVLVAGDVCLADVCQRYGSQRILCRAANGGTRCLA